MFAMMTDGYVRLWRNPRSVGYGPERFQGEAPLALILHGGDARPPGPGFHLALAAPGVVPLPVEIEVAVLSPRPA
jgi:hypothetical protein